MDYDGHYYDAEQTFYATEADANLLITIASAVAVDEIQAKPEPKRKQNYSRRDMRASP